MAGDPAPATLSGSDPGPLISEDMGFEAACAGSSHGWLMRCYFHLLNGHEIIADDTGVEILDLEKAHEYALLAIADIRAEAIEFGESWQGWRLDVVDPSGNILLSIPLDPMRH